MVLFTHPAGRRAAAPSWAEELQTPTGSRAALPNHFICSLAVWLPYTSAGFGHRRHLKKEKHHSLPSLCLIHSSSVRVDCYPHVCNNVECVLPHTFKPMQMKTVKTRPPGWAMPGQRKIFPVGINEAQCPAHVSPPLHRHARGWLRGSVSCSAHSG